MIKWWKKKINMAGIAHSVTIVDEEGNNHPYMLSQSVRNDSKLVKFDYLFFDTNKALNEILIEAKIALKTEKCNISEGNGWYSQGTRYFYKDYYTEV